jgi:hypothetical protein
LQGELLAKIIWFCFHFFHQSCAINQCSNKMFYIACVCTKSHRSIFWSCVKWPLMLLV